MTDGEPHSEHDALIVKEVVTTSALTANTCPTVIASLSKSCGIWVKIHGEL